VGAALGEAAFAAAWAAGRLPSILPPLSFEEALEATKLYSIAARGPAPAAVRFAAKTQLPRLPAGQALLTRRPYRAPHHSISDAGLIGGGSIPRPREVTLADPGVPLLDERMPGYEGVTSRTAWAKDRRASSPRVSPSIKPRTSPSMPAPWASGSSAANSSQRASRRTQRSR
jgi:hypothetical protein